MPAYVVTPNDTLFFRGGEPMGIGESHFQTSIFPPSPETFVGAVRTTVITHNCDSDFEGYKTGKYADTTWFGEIGMKELPDTFRFSGPYLRKGKEIFLPPPSNLFSNPGKTKFAIASPRRFQELEHSSVVPQIMWIEAPGEGTGKDWKPVENWISVEGIKKYLRGSADSLTRETDFVATCDLFKDEGRVGIALERNGLRTARKGHLYSTVHKRFSEEIGMVFFLDGVPSFPDTALIRLGGENRTAWCERIDDVEFPSLQDSVDFLVTTMPVKAERVANAVPVTEFIDEGMHAVLPGGVRSRMVSYAAGRPVLFGGWDLMENRAKEMVQYVPAGSVFCFERCSVNGRSNKYLLGGSDVH
jgi:CRISPR-associated protein Cmr3